MRRPGDIFIENLLGYGPTCMDFAVTSGSQEASIEGSIDNAAYAVKAYERAKRVVQPEGASGTTEVLWLANWHPSGTADIGSSCRRFRTSVFLEFEYGGQKFMGNHRTPHLLLRQVHRATHSMQIMRV